jgi:hypothetical protein
MFLVSLFGLAGFFFLAIDSVLLSFKIQHLSQVIKSAQEVREKLELEQSALFSPASLENYAEVVKLNHPVSINYLVKEAGDLVLNSRQRVE